MSAEQGGQEHISAVGVGPIARDELWAASVRVGRARRIAERALRGSLEANGTPVILHVRRVAKSSPIFARSVAWLHDVLEDSSVSEEELLASGLTDEELRALRLLTRDVIVDPPSTTSPTSPTSRAPPDRPARSPAPSSGRILPTGSGIRTGAPTDGIRPIRPHSRSWRKKRLNLGDPRLDRQSPIRCAERTVIEPVSEGPQVATFLADEILDHALRTAPPPPIPSL